MVNSLAVLALFAILTVGKGLKIEDDEPVVTQEMVDLINADGDWVASLDWVQDMTVAEAKRLMGLIWGHDSDLPVSDLGALEDYLTIPTSFDSRTQWPGCIGAIRNQGRCGSCWAVSAAEVLSDRKCIATNSTVKVVLSPQWLVSCDKSNYGCSGGYLNNVWTYMKNHGIPLDSADPYTSGTTGTNGVCPTSTPLFYKATIATQYRTPITIQTAILVGGPVQTGFYVYQDFMSYYSGVYVHKTGVGLGGHAVKIIGWGVSGTQKYWIVANSWGTTWGGLQGFFWIAWGQCGIDSYAIAGNAL